MVWHGAGVHHPGNRWTPVRLAFQRLSRSSGYEFGVYVFTRYSRHAMLVLKVVLMVFMGSFQDLITAESELTKRTAGISSRPTTERVCTPA